MGESWDFLRKDFPLHLGHPGGWQKSAASPAALTDWEDEADGKPAGSRPKAASAVSATEQNDLKTLPGMSVRAGRRKQPSRRTGS